MLHTINPFMWPYQTHFRTSLEQFAKRVLLEASSHLDVAALLVGVEDSVSEGHFTCVEPASGEWPVELFDDIEARIGSLAAEDSRQRMMYGDLPSNREKDIWIRATAARDAIAERLTEIGHVRGVQSFCGEARRVSTYLVVPVLQISTSDLRHVSSLRRRSRKDRDVHASFVEALIEETLRDASRALGGEEPGRQGDTFDRDPVDVLRVAGRTMMAAPELEADPKSLGALFEGCTQISALRHEGSASWGKMIIARSGHPSVRTLLQFLRPVPIRAATWARKILEMGSDEVMLLCDGTAIYGLGEIRDTYDASSEEVFLVDFVGHYTWELLHGSKVLMRTAYAVPRLSSARILEDDVRALLHRVFGDGEELDTSRIWALVLGAIEEKHGTLLVVSDHAADEALRLAAEATLVSATELTDSLMRRVTGIDGAVLVGVDGRCHAIGVILDGAAVPDGDPARGARFNSALRYVTTASTRTVALVVSEDGHVNALPVLPPQTERHEVEHQVTSLDGLGGGPRSDSHHERGWLDEHRFYLTPVQCEKVNQDLRGLERIAKDPAIVDSAPDEG